jgi:hypothetical protein
MLFLHTMQDTTLPAHHEKMWHRGHSGIMFSTANVLEALSGMAAMAFRSLTVLSGSAMLSGLSVSFKRSLF